MANLNLVHLIGRLTRDPESRTFASGGKVCQFGFAVNNRRKNSSTGEWEDEPVFLDVKAFNRQQGGRQLADLCEQHLSKGKLAYVQGHLTLEQWTTQDGQKRSALKVILDDVQFLTPKGDSGSQAPSRPSRPAPSPPGDAFVPPEDSTPFVPPDDLPF